MNNHGPMGQDAGQDRKGVARLLRERVAAQPLAPCENPRCAGCYEVRAGVRLHPPKPSQEWEDWLARWQPDGGDLAQ